MSNSVPFIDLKTQYQGLKAEVREVLDQVMESQSFILGPQVHEFESEVAKKTGSKHAVGVASGTDALYLALRALKIGSGDEVITTPYTFYATVSSICQAGAKPVFVDVESKTFNLDPSKIKKKITKKTKAILPVHLFGLPCDMNAILKIAKENKLFVIEDAAQAFGAFYRGKPAGTLGDAGCFSFYPTKNLGACGDGGMVVTSNGRLAEHLRLLRQYGSHVKYIHKLVGTNSRLDTLQAAILLVKLKRIDSWNELRRKHAAVYAEGLKGLPVQVPYIPEDRTHIYHLYSVLTPSRDKLVKFLSEKKIGTAIHYPMPLHFQSCFKNLGYKKGSLPVSEETSRKIVSLPMYPEMPLSHLAAVVSAIREFFSLRQ